METILAEISEEEVKSLTQVLLSKYGIDFTCYEPKSLRRRINRIMGVFQCNTVFELWSKLLKDESMVFTFMNEISVGMTSMFRDPILWKALRQRIVEDYVEKDSINLWHAGCSTGEEVYSMGIVLKETHLLQKAKGLATDMNKDAIAEAMRGTYHKIKMIANENNYREYIIGGDFTKYYTREDQHAKMDPKLIAHVNFNYHNLITDPIFGQFDIIFCRNVMIYFDNRAKSKLLDKFHAALKPGGYFIIGFYDTLLSLVDEKRFNLVDPNAKIFQKVS